VCVHRVYEDDFEPDADSSPAVSVGDGPNRTSSDLGSTSKKSSAAAGTTPSWSSATTNKDDIYDFSNVQY